MKHENPSQPHFQREEKKIPRWKCRDYVLPLGEYPLIMGILNITPDSFSDGGCYFDCEKAVMRGLRMAGEGADIIDVGGESTRPGAGNVDVSEELRRVIPVIEGLKKRTGAVISIDTMKAEVARRALEAGASIINDISALTGDSGMARVASEYGAGVVLMHMKGTPRTMQNNPQYKDVVIEVRDYLKSRIEDAVSMGLDPQSLAIDPGIGFGKTIEHNVELIAKLEILVEMGLPVVIGLSRKSFLGKLTGREVIGRLPAGLSALAVCVLKGAHVMRVHDVQESCDAAKIAAVLAGPGTLGRYPVGEDGGKK